MPSNNKLLGHAYFAIKEGTRAEGEKHMIIKHYLLECKKYELL